MHRPTQRQPKLVFCFHHLCCLGPGIRLAFLPCNWSRGVPEDNSFPVPPECFSVNIYFSLQQIITSGPKGIISFGLSEAWGSLHRHISRPWALLKRGKACAILTWEDLRTDHTHPTLAAAAQNMAMCRAWWLQLEKLPHNEPIPKINGIKTHLHCTEKRRLSCSLFTGRNQSVTSHQKHSISRWPACPHSRLSLWGKKAHSYTEKSGTVTALSAPAKASHLT